VVLVGGEATVLLEALTTVWKVVVTLVVAVVDVVDSGLVGAGSDDATSVVAGVDVVGAELVGAGPEDEGSHTGGPGFGYGLAPSYRLKKIPGSVAE
jgi:hypothetical protein